MTPRAVVIGVGNVFRSDDGVGPAVIAALQARRLPELTLSVCDGEPTQLLDLWEGVPLAIVVDAVLCQPSRPGKVHCTDLVEAGSARASASSHGLGIPDALRLAEVLDRAPGRLVIYAVEAADLGLGRGLSRPVADAVPTVVDQILAQIADQSPASIGRA